MTHLRANRRANRRNSERTIRPTLEALENRGLLTVAASAGLVPAILESTANDTVDVAQDLGAFSGSGSAQVLATIGGPASATSDVDWYRFTLDRPGHVRVTARADGMTPGFHPVLGLYVEDPYNFQDPADASGYRLLMQAGGPSTDAPGIDRDLGPGTYEIAVSGAGNLDFHPLLAGSGLPGETGGYDLLVESTEIPIGVGEGPRVLESDPAPGSVLERSPVAIRLGMTSALLPDTIFPGDTVRLIYSPVEDFGSAEVRDVPLTAVNFSVAANELQIFPARALGPGYYRILLAGDASAGSAILTDTSGTPLGATEDAPGGRDTTIGFRVSGVEGGAGPADDTAAQSHDLGDLTTSGPVRVVGAIGDDPFFDPSKSEDPYSPDQARNPANDVDMYHFRVTGPGRYAFVAEVMARRIGSALDPGISLYRVGPDGHTLLLVATANDTFNPSVAADGSVPLLTDSVLYAGLTAGDYFVAVADGLNLSLPNEDRPPGSLGQFDPAISHSGLMGQTAGPYVLMMELWATPDSPRVVATSLHEGQVLDRAPTGLTVTFDAPINFQALVFAAQFAGDASLSNAITIRGADGTIYSPRLVSYDAQSCRAGFLMLDALPEGEYTLHISGAAGLTDLGGNPLEGNDPGGDYVVHFRVAGQDRGQVDTTSGGLFIASQLDLSGFQELGVLFPHELQGTVVVNHLATDLPGDSTDRAEYRFELLQDQTYTVTLDGEGLPAGVRLTLYDDLGEQVSFGSSDDGRALFGQLARGTYRLRIEGMTADLAYRVRISAATSSDNATPLLSGPAPALSLQFTTTTPARSPLSTPSPEPISLTPTPTLNVPVYVVTDPSDGPTTGLNSPVTTPSSAPSPISEGQPAPPAISASPYISAPAAIAASPAIGAPTAVSASPAIWGPSSSTAVVADSSPTSSVPDVAVGHPALTIGGPAFGASGLDTATSTGHDGTGSGPSVASSGSPAGGSTGSAAPGLSLVGLLAFGAGPAGGIPGSGIGDDGTVVLTLNLPAPGVPSLGAPSLATLLAIGTVGLVEQKDHPPIPSSGEWGEADAKDAPAAESEAPVAGTGTSHDVAIKSGDGGPIEILETASMFDGPITAVSIADANADGEHAATAAALGDGSGEEAPPGFDILNSLGAASRTIPLIAVASALVAAAASRRVRRLVGPLLRRMIERRVDVPSEVADAFGQEDLSTFAVSPPDRPVPGRDRPAVASNVHPSRIEHSAHG